MRDGYPRGSISRTPTPRQVDVLAAFVAAGSVTEAALRVGIRPSTAKRHPADLRARSGLTTEQLIYCGRAEGWLVVAALEPYQEREAVAELQYGQPGPRQGLDRGTRNCEDHVARTGVYTTAPHGASPSARASPAFGAKAYTLP